MQFFFSIYNVEHNFYAYLYGLQFRDQPLIFINKR